MTGVLGVPGQSYGNLTRCGGYVLRRNLRSFYLHPHLLTPPAAIPVVPDSTATADMMQHGFLLVTFWQNQYMHTPSYALLFPRFAFLNREDGKNIQDMLNVAKCAEKAESSKVPRGAQVSEANNIEYVATFHILAVEKARFVLFIFDTPRKSLPKSPCSVAGANGD